MVVPGGLSSSMEWAHPAIRRVALLQFAVFHGPTNILRGRNGARMVTCKLKHLPDTSFFFPFALL